MKKFWIPLALMLAVPTLCFADGSFGWQTLEFRTTYTSSTTPTFASQFGSAENTGIRFRDSLTFAVNTAKGADTTAAFSLPGWTPGIWAGADTLNGTAGTTGISTTGAKANVTAADSVFAFVVAVGPAAVSPNGTTAASDSAYFFLQGSVNGTSWFEIQGTATGLTGNAVAEAGSSSQNIYAYYTSGKARPVGNGVAAPNIMFWPLLRIIIVADAAGTASTGDYGAKVGYFADKSIERQR